MATPDVNWTTNQYFPVESIVLDALCKARFGGGPRPMLCRG